MQIIEFAPPLVGLDHEFNTFRLGLFLSKTLKVGDRVLLSNSKTKNMFGGAEVLAVTAGKLGEQLNLHAGANHTQLALGTDGASERLLQVMQKIYGPHIAMLTRSATVVYLRRINGSVQIPRP